MLVLVISRFSLRQGPKTTVLKVAYFCKIEISYKHSFPGGSDSKELACNAGDLGSIPGSGRSPGGGNGNPLQSSCLGNPMDRGAWWATVHGAQRVGQDGATNVHMSTVSQTRGLHISPCAAVALWKVVPGKLRAFLGSRGRLDWGLHLVGVPVGGTIFLAPGGYTYSGVDLSQAHLPLSVAGPPSVEWPTVSMPRSQISPTELLVHLQKLGAGGGTNPGSPGEETAVFQGAISP